MTTEKKHIFVTGDIAMDNNIYKGIRKSPELKKYGTQISKTKGGSYLLNEIISQTISKSTPLKLAELAGLIQKKEEEIGKEKLSENPDKLKNLESLEKGLAYLNKEKLNWENTLCHYGLKEGIFDYNSFPESLKTYATWSIKEFATPKPFQKIYGDKTKAWKVTEMMGWGQEKKEDDKKNEKEKSDNEQAPLFVYHENKAKEFQHPDILVFDDGGNNFRNDVKAWNDLLYEKSEGNKGKARNIAQVILKTAYPLGHGNLFRSLTKDFSKKLTIVTSINEIRKEDVLISKGVSWEQTALDLVSELKHNKSISHLLNCKRLIINFQSEGALYIETGDNNKIIKCRLIFDPEHMEGDWSKAGKIEGDVFGLMLSFIAAVIYSILEASIKACLENKSIEEKNKSVICINQWFVGHAVQL